MNGSKCRVSTAEPPRGRGSGWLAPLRCKSFARMSSRISWKRLALGVALFSAFAAAADEAKGPKIVRQPDKVIVRKRTVVDFGDVTVQGELVKPEGSYVLNRNKTRFPPLIQLRDDFDAELRKSAGDIQDGRDE
jgi:hypothetical protein